MKCVFNSKPKQRNPFSLLKQPCRRSHARPLRPFLTSYLTTKQPELESEQQFEQSIDVGRESRQVAVYGIKSLETIGQASVLVCGLSGLGVEIAKNIALAGVKRLNLFDDGVVQLRDLCTQFYLTDNDVSSNRAQASIAKIQTLKQSVQVNACQGSLSEDLVSRQNCVVLTNSNLQESKKINEWCRLHGVAFIHAEVRGVFCSVFCDFGEQFTVFDSNGQEPKQGIIADIKSGKQTQILTVEDEILKLTDDDWVYFSGVKGMEELNKLQPVQIFEKEKNSFKIDVDSTKFGKFDRGGVAIEYKKPQVLNFKSLTESTQNSDELSLNGTYYKEHGIQIHIAFKALHQFEAQFGVQPRTNCEEDAQIFLQIAKEFCFQTLKNHAIKVDEELMRKFAKQARGEICAMSSLVGGFVSQEVIKSITGKFTPLFQHFYFDSLQALPQVYEPSTTEFLTQGNRYDGQILLFGKTIQNKLQNLKVFVIGAGASGCEILKNFALMGVGCGKQGLITVTDDDLIEGHNLSRQFLFQEDNINDFKSTVAKQAAIQINPQLKIEALHHRVDENSEDIFDDDFWSSQNVVVTALDNLNSRAYVDKKCAFHQKPLLDCGTLGTKCSTQTIVPHVTDNYMQTSEEQQIPLCTLRSYPYNKTHCLTWARELFGRYFEEAPRIANIFLDDPDKFIEEVKTQGGWSIDEVELVVDLLQESKSSCFEDCVVWARTIFQQYFCDNISQLLHDQPDEKQWMPPKRFPHILNYDEQDSLHQQLIQAGAILRAQVLGVPEHKIVEDPSQLANIASKVQIEQFVPQGETNPINSTQQSNDHNGSVSSMEVFKLLQNIYQKLPKNFKTNIVSFEKDNDENFHIDFIHAVANLRARNYNIEQTSKLETKLIVGKITPAISTSTAFAAGLLCLELYKVIQQKPIQDYRNNYANLATPIIFQMEPNPPKISESNGVKWSQQDKWVIEGNVTVQHVLDWFRGKSLECSGISYRGRLIYTKFDDKDRLEQKIKELITLLYPDIAVSEYNRFLEIDVLCRDSSGEDIDVPSVYIKLR